MKQEREREKEKEINFLNISVSDTWKSRCIFFIEKKR